MDCMPKISQQNINSPPNQPSKNSQPGPSPGSDSTEPKVFLQQIIIKSPQPNQEKCEKTEIKPRDKEDLNVESYSKTGFDWQAQRSTEPMVSIKEREAYLPINCTEIYLTRPNIDVSNFSSLPSAKLSAKLSDVGGLENQIIKLKQSLVLPLLYPDFCQKYSITPSRGIMFHGPPGTGKTLLARALVNECSTESLPIAYFHFASSDILSKWVGESEARISAIFEAAKLWQPSILFFDEIDGLAPIRVDEDRPSASFVSALLSKMDGINDLGRVLVIGSTNRLESIDPALRRPGRFDEELLFPLPNVATREEIIRICLRNWFANFSDEFIAHLAQVTNGFNGADLTSLCYKAATNALFRVYPGALEFDRLEKVLLESVIPTEADFFHALESINPSIQRSSNFSLQPIKSPCSFLLKQAVNDSLQFLAPGVIDKQVNQFQPRICVVEDSSLTLAHEVLLTVAHSLSDCRTNFIDFSKIALMNELAKVNELATLLESSIYSSQPELIVFPAIDDLLEKIPELSTLMRHFITFPASRGNKMVLFSCEKVHNLSSLLNGVDGKLVSLNSVPAEDRFQFFDSVFHDYFDPNFLPVKPAESNCVETTSSKHQVNGVSEDRANCLVELVSLTKDFAPYSIIELVNGLDLTFFSHDYASLHNYICSTFDEVDVCIDDDGEVEYF